jgi:asparagine N-glycosylation enzyme membrane subunit Stt3
MQEARMELKTNPTDIRWWFWLVTLAFIAMTVAGVPWAHWPVIALSGIQVLFFFGQEKSLVSFPTQIRVVYFLFTLFGLWPATRLPIYVVLLIGTIMVTFFGRCAIALMLKQMPWNHGREVRLN